VEGTVNVATVQVPAVAPGQPVSVLLAVKFPSAAVSASSAWDTVVVPMVLSSDASATMAASVESLQSKVILVVPGVTPTIKLPTMAPEPAETVTLHVALACGALRAAPAEPEKSAKPESDNAIATLVTASDLMIECGLEITRRVVDVVIGGYHPYDRAVGIERTLCVPVYHSENGRRQ
jgi:hypothetical protein